MSDTSAHDPRTRPTERLDVPTLPAPSSRFVLPPPPSDLLNRLQAFLPQIRDANAQLEMRPDGEEVEEPVVMEELSEDSDSSDDDDSSSEESDEDEQVEGPAETGELEAVDEGVQGGEQLVKEEEGGSLAHLMDISARTKVVKSKLLVEETGESAAGAQGE